MNGLRPKEILEVIEALEVAASRGARARPVLATVVSRDGSVYNEAGAMAVLVSGAGGRPWVISADDLGDGLRRHYEAAASSGRPQLASLEVAEDDPILGLGLGAPGSLELLLEPADRPLRDHFREVRDALLKGEGVVSSVEIQGAAPGRRTLLPAEDPAARECYRGAGAELVEEAADGRIRRALRCAIRPMGKVLVFGSGHDAARLVSHLTDLGFFVFAADPRRGRLRGPDWDDSRALLVTGGWEQARAAARPDEDTAVVVMTHSLALDREILAAALQTPAFYVGRAGSPQSALRLLTDLEEGGIHPRPGAYCAPAGLDLGAETPKERALAIAAEILAARTGRPGGRLSPRRSGAAAAADKPKTAGLILAAGRGRRFTAGNKLAASLDGRPVLRHVVENALAARLDPVVVVLGCGAEAGLKAIAGIEDPRLRVVFNPLWQGGKASSMEVGLREVPFASPGVVALLGDMPRVPAWLIDRVVSEFELSGKLTFPVYPGPEGPRKGYPTAFPRALFGEIRALTGDDTAMAAVREHWAEALKIPLEDAATQADVDTPQDLQLLLGGRSAGD